MPAENPSLGSEARSTGSDRQRHAVVGPAEVAEASYEFLSFPPGETPDWRHFGELFVERALLGLRVFPSDPEISVLSLGEYAESQMRHDLQREGYSETAGQRIVEVVGDIATVRQAFTMNFAGREPVDAVDVFSLVRMTEGWRIVSVVSDAVQPGTPDSKRPPITDDARHRGQQ
jgi:hypothetical protein